MSSQASETNYRVVSWPYLFHVSPTMLRNQLNIDAKW